jgi:predicted phage terminase large subunit-like protein
LSAELASRSLKEFVIQAWPILEPATPFVDGIHISAMCLHLQAVSKGEIANLIINVPPGHAKSLITAVFWPAWLWIHHPEARMLYSSNRMELAIRDSLKCRRLIESPWYQENWGDRYQLREDQNTKERFENTRGGYRVVVAIGAGTGERGDYVVVDDPHTVDGVESDTQRRSVIEWWNGSMATRVNDLATGHKVVIQQRLHELDLTGDLLRRGGYELLCLPAEFEPELRCTTPIGWTDPRTEAGELLWPQKISQRDLEGLKASLGSYRYAGQYQQRPAPAAGGIFQKPWFRFYQPPNVELGPVEVCLPDGTVARIQAVPLPAQFDVIIQSWDMAFKDSDTSDYVVGQVLGALKADRFLLDQRRARLDMPDTKEAVKEMKKKWPRTAAILVEDKANGPAVIQELGHDIPGLIEVTPEGGKTARAHAAAPQIESGNLYLPHPQFAPWVEELIEEFAAFPNGRYDDQVDATTQALNWLRNRICRFSAPESQITIDPMEKIPETWPHGFGMAITKIQRGGTLGSPRPKWHYLPLRRTPPSGYGTRPERQSRSGVGQVDTRRAQPIGASRIPRGQNTNRGTIQETGPGGCLV